MTAAEDAAAGKRFSAAAFAQGTAAVLALYAALFLWLALSAGKTAEQRLKHLASQTVLVEWKTEKAAPAPKTHNPAHPAHEEPSPPPSATDTGYGDADFMQSALPVAPLEGLYEDTAQGRKPVIRHKDETTPFNAYRRAFDIHADDDPLVIIAIAGLGLSDVATESAVRTMPPEISFILSPYGGTLDLWTRESRARGHEIWLSLPTESTAYPQDDSGPHTMLVGVPEQENLAKLDWLLTRTDGYAGFVGNANSAFMDAPNDLRPVLGAIYARGLGFIDGSSPAGLIPETMAIGMKAAYAAADLWIDSPDPSQAAIDASLKKLEDIAREKGYAIGIIRPVPVSYQQILKWIPTLPGKHLRLAPLSAPASGS